MQVTTISLDIAKDAFQVHGIDAAEKVVIRKPLRRAQVMKFFETLPPSRFSPAIEPRFTFRGPDVVEILEEVSILRMIRPRRLHRATRFTGLNI